MDFFGRLPRAARLTYCGAALALLTVGAVAVTPARVVLATPRLCAPARARGDTITVHSKGFRITKTPVIRRDLVTIRYISDGGIWTRVLLGRLKRGVTPASVLHTLRNGNEDYYNKLTVAMGGLSGPSDEAMVVRLSPGVYVLHDRALRPSGTPWALGIRFFRVVDAKLGCALPPGPPTVGQVSMTEFAFHMPATLPAGKHWIDIENDGKQLHNWVIMKLRPGKTAEQAVKAQTFGMPNDEPFPSLPYGSMQHLSPGRTAELHLELVPGKYVVIDDEMDPKTHQLHYQLGMYAAFSVT